MKRFCCWGIVFAVLLCCTACGKKTAVSNIAPEKEAASSFSQVTKAETLEKSGIVSEVNKDNIVVEFGDEKLTFALQEAVKLPEKLAPDTRVKVQYTRKQNEKTTQVQLLKISVIQTEHSSFSTQTAEKESEISGEIIDATMHTITIRAEEKNYTFLYDTDDVSTAVQAPSGFANGSMVKISYIGEIGRENCVAVKINEYKK